MRPLIALSLLAVTALVACGGGGPRSSVDDGVTPVTIEPRGLVPSGADGWASWHDSGSRVVICDELSPDRRTLVLKHEVWHLLTRVEGHPNVEPDCVSGPVLADLSAPCPEEVAQVLAFGRTVTLSFPEDPVAAEQAAAWWNAAAGRDVVFVVPFPDTRFGVAH